MDSSEIDPSEHVSKKSKTSDKIDYQEQIIKRCIQAAILGQITDRLQNTIAKFLADYKPTIKHDIDEKKLQELDISISKEEYLRSSVIELSNKTDELYPDEIYEIINESILDIKEMIKS